MPCKHFISVRFRVWAPFLGGVMKLEKISSDLGILIRQYCKSCGCTLEEDTLELGWILSDGKRSVRIFDFNKVCEEASKLKTMHKLEDSLKNERDFRKRRKIRNKLYAGIV